MLDGGRGAARVGDRSRPWASWPRTSPRWRRRAGPRALAATSLLPQAELTFQSALAGYENGKVDFATLLDAQRQIRRAKQERLKAQAEAQMRLADIERIVGEEL